MKEIKEFFVDNGITQVTIQPEFFTRSIGSDNLPLPKCLMQCRGEDCKNSHCCPTLKDDKKGSIISSSKHAAKEKLPGELELDLKSVKVLETDLNSSTNSLKSESFEILENQDDSLKAEIVNEAIKEAPCIESAEGAK